MNFKRSHRSTSLHHRKCSILFVRQGVYHFLEALVSLAAQSSPGNRWLVTYVFISMRFNDWHLLIFIHDGNDGPPAEAHVKSRDSVSYCFHSARVLAVVRLIKRENNYIKPSGGGRILITSEVSRKSESQEPAKNRNKT